MRDQKTRESKRAAERSEITPAQRAVQLLRAGQLVAGWEILAVTGRRRKPRWHVVRHDADALVLVARANDSESRRLWQACAGDPQLTEAWELEHLAVEVTTPVEWLSANCLGVRSPAEAKLCRDERWESSFEADQRKNLERAREKLFHWEHRFRASEGHDRTKAMMRRSHWRNEVGRLEQSLKRIQQRRQVRQLEIHPELRGVVQLPTAESNGKRRVPRSP